MNLLKALALAVGSWTVSLCVAFALLALTAGLGGRGTARLAWLVPVHVAVLAAIYVAATVLFHVVVRGWLPAVGWRWLATGVVGAGFALTFVAVALATLVVLNR